MPKRARLCERGLQLGTPEAKPQHWARLQVELGYALFQNPQGNRGENLERAIAAFQAALTVYTRDASPEHWALIQVNLEPPPTLTAFGATGGSTWSGP